MATSGKVRKGSPYDAQFSGISREEFLKNVRQPVGRTAEQV
jgi:hypothetical protein